MLFLALLVACAAPDGIPDSTPEGNVLPTEVRTCTDIFPRFGGPLNCTKTAVNGVRGSWSKPSTWVGGAVPDDNDNVYIPSGSTVWYDIKVNPPNLDAIEIEGTLSVANNAEIWLNNLMVLPDGKLIIGSKTNSINAKIVIRDTAPDTGSVTMPGTDPRQYGTGVIVLGKISVWGHEKTAFIRSDEDIDSGATTVSLDTAYPSPVNWNMGDTIIIPETAQTILANDRNNPPIYETEKFTLASNVKGHTISLAASQACPPSPTFDHHGITCNPWEINRYAHIANITRSVVFCSESPEGNRGHFMVTADADVDINSAAFIGLGRTKAQPLDNTRFDLGVVEHIGTNQVGRYSVHFHELTGTPDNDDMNATGKRRRIRNSVVEDALKWGITIHGTSINSTTNRTNDSLVHNNIVYKTNGAAFATERGKETGTTFTDNMVIKVDGGFQKDWWRGAISRKDFTAENPFPAIVNAGADGSGFWLRTCAGTVTDNFVYDCVGYGFQVNGYYRPSDGSDDNTARQFEAFARNEVCSSKGGLWLTWSQGHHQDPSGGLIENSYERQTVTDFFAWHVDSAGVRAWHDGIITFDNITIICDPNVSFLCNGNNQDLTQITAAPEKHNVHGMAFADFALIREKVVDMQNTGTAELVAYENFDYEINGARIYGCKIGISAPVRPGHGCTLNDPELANYVNIAYLHSAPDVNLANQNFLQSTLFLTDPLDSLPDCVSNDWVQPIPLFLDFNGGNAIPEESTPGTSSSGDMNCDGNVDQDDSNAFYAAHNSGSYNHKADMNQNGELDPVDIDLFEDLVNP